MKNEIYVPLKNYEQEYKISNHGNICSIKYKKTIILKQTKNSHGYKLVTLCKNGYVKIGLLHRLVAEAFITNPENKPQVNHIDNCTYNNYFENLEWVTSKENYEHSRKQGRSSVLLATKSLILQNNKKRILTYEQAQEIRKLYSLGETKSSLAKKFSVCNGVIYHIVNNETYVNNLQMA